MNQQCIRRVPVQTFLEMPAVNPRQKYTRKGRIRSVPYADTTLPVPSGISPGLPERVEYRRNLADSARIPDGQLMTLVTACDTTDTSLTRFCSIFLNAVDIRPALSSR